MLLLAQCYFSLYFSFLCALVLTEMISFVAGFSAGVGRTGAFIALDCLLDQADAEGVVDVFALTNQMRKDRINMIQTVVSTPLSINTVVAGLIITTGSLLRVFAATWLRSHELLCVIVNSIKNFLEFLENFFVCL